VAAAVDGVATVVDGVSACATTSMVEGADVAAGGADPPDGVSACAGSAAAENGPP
jgi:hypothetical protein